MQNNKIDIINGWMHFSVSDHVENVSWHIYLQMTI